MNDRHQFGADGLHHPILCDACNAAGLNELAYAEVYEIIFAALDRTPA